jgi:SAM-dependent methyltransferase
MMPPAMSNSLNSTGRFSSRVADYVKYRPEYPRQIVRMLQEAAGLSPDWIVADVGCGTGISCRMFLENGNQVFGVEPNDDMRGAAEMEFASRPGFLPVKGTAEATTLADASVDLVVAAQAYHWFDKPATAQEFKRILRVRKGGFMAIMWNTRSTATAFLAEYDRLLQTYGTDYNEVMHRSEATTDDFALVFGVPFTKMTAPNEQLFTHEDLCGRMRSASYAPMAGQPGHDELYAGLKKAFDDHQQNGRVKFEYVTELYLGRLV